LSPEPQGARAQEGKRWVWTGATAVPRIPPAPEQERAPLTYSPPSLAEKILTSRSALAGERKQVTVRCADLKGSMERRADRDPEAARQLLDPVLERMMAAVHRYEGTVNQVMGDGIMALFGAALAHEDHAVRACTAALAMQAAVQQYAAEVQRTKGGPVQIRVRLNAGEVVVRAIGNGLRMDYSAIGQTTHLAARREQMAMPGSRRTRCTAAWRSSEAWALRLLGEVAAQLELADGAEAATYYRQSLTLANTLGMRPLVAHCHYGLGTLYTKMGRWDTARSELSAAIELYRTMEMTFWLPQAQAAVAEVEGR